MKAMKRMTAMLLALVLFAGLLPATVPQANAAISSSTFAAKVQDFINDSRWKNGIAWGGSQKPKLSTWSSTGCCAYAADFVAYVYGSTSAAWTTSDFTKFTNLNEIRAGDIIHTSNHWFVVVERNGNTLRTVEGNFEGEVRVTSDGWGIKNGKIYNLEANGERTFEYGYHYNFSDGSSNTTYSSSQIYHNIDFSANVLASRINQIRVNDCAVVAMATVEAYLYGATSSSEKDVVYNTLLQSQGTGLSAQWAKCGFNSSTAIDWNKVYEQLTKGYPVMVYRGDHWGLVSGYKGSTTTLEKDKFIIVNFYRGTGGTDIADSGTWRKGSTISKMAIRKNGIVVTGLSGIRMAINHPAPVHQYGSGHGVYGYVTSNVNLTSVQVKVTNAAGTAVYNKTLTPNAKSYLIYNLDSEMTFAKWAKGKYTYTVTAKTASASRTYQYSFEIASGWPVTESQQKYVFTFNANGGTGAPANQTIYFGGTLHIPAATPTREGYTFLGWYAMRNGDQTWYSAGNGWFTEAQLTAAGYSKRLYPTDTDFVINNSWLSGCMNTTGFTFYAQWEKNAPITYTVSYNANGGTGAPAAQTKTGGTALTLSTVVPTRDGYTFLGWSTSADGAVAYQSGASFTTDANTTLYAVWEKNEVTLSGIAIESLPAKTTYQIGDALDISGLKIKLTYSDATTQIITTGFTTSGFSSAAAGAKTITVSYSGKTTSFTVIIEAPANGPKYEITDAVGAAGATVEVYVSIANNPGIISLRNTISYDSSALELIAVQDCKLLAGYTTPSTTVNSPYTLRWADSLATDNNSSNGRLVKLTFRIMDDAQTGDYSISVDPVEARNANGEKVTFRGASATIKVIEYIVGDTDGDGEISDWDAIVLNRYLAGWNVPLELGAADTDGDGEVSDWDAIVLERYLAGWDISLGS